jgi:pilus assembly protein CpaF
MSAGADALEPVGMMLEPEPATPPPSMAPSATPQPAQVLQMPQPAITAVPMPVAAVAASSTPGMDRAEALRCLHLLVVDALGLRGLELAQLPHQKAKAGEVALRMIRQWQKAGRIDASIDAGELAEAVASLSTDLDLILDLVQDESCVEIAVTYDRQMLADREGRLEPIDRMISSEDQVIDLIRRLGVLGGANPGPDRPLVDVRLRDGARVVATLPPLSFRGPTLSFRKTTRDWFTLDKLFEYSTISKQMMDFIDYCVRFRTNLLLSVGPGVSPTATMNALVAQMPTDDRIVTIENGVELHFGQTHRNVTALEPTPELGLLDLVRHAVTMQADRLILGELKGDTTYEVLQAIAGPLEGSVCGYSARSPLEAIDRIARIELHSVFPTAIPDAKRLVAAAFPVVIQERKFLDNSRRITAVSEVMIDGEDVVVEDIFRFKPEGVDDNLIVTGTFHATGHRPTFLEELSDRGEAEIDLSIFDA